MYMAGTSRSRLLESCYFESQTWGALHKAWKGYIIAKNKYEPYRLVHYAEVIQKLQRELGLPVSSFPSLGLSPKEQARDSSADYEPYEPIDRIMRNEQAYVPPEDYDPSMRSEQTYDPNEEFDRTMKKEQTYDPNEEFDRTMKKEQKFYPFDA